MINNDKRMHTMKRWQDRSGFTIVELLIVIVVIAILAAITIVAYNGIQEKAESTRIVSLANAYIKGLKLWSAETGSPITTSSCNAPPASITGGTCPLSPRWNVNTPYDASFNQTLLNKSGISAHTLGRYGEASPVGSMWYHANYYGDNRSVLFYEVGPNTNCGLPGVLSQNPGWDNATLLGASYSGRTAGYTQCLIEVTTF